MVFASPTVGQLKKCYIVKLNARQRKIEITTLEQGKVASYNL